MNNHVTDADFLDYQEWLDTQEIQEGDLVHVRKHTGYQWVGRVLPGTTVINKDVTLFSIADKQATRFAYTNEITKL